MNYWFDKNQGCVVNLTISKYARVTVTRNFTNKFNVKSLNTKRGAELTSFRFR